MKRYVLILCLICVVLTSFAQSHDAGINSVGDTVVKVDYGDGLFPGGSLESRKAFLRHIRDSIDAIPFDTTRDDDYWRRAIACGKWSFFTDTTVKKPLVLDFAYKVYDFYSRAFNNYDTAYVVGIDKDFKVMVKNDNWLDTYGGVIADRSMKIFMNSDVNSSVGLHFSYMGIGYTYMFDLDNVFGGDPTRHSRWDLSFATSRFSFEAYKSRNTGRVTIGRFGDYNNKRYVNRKFYGLAQRTSGFDMYYFFNHRRYSQSAAYGFSKIQRRSAGSFIAGLLVATQNIDVDFTELPQEMRDCLPSGQLVYKYHHRSYCFLLGYAYNWVLGRNWLFNITIAPSLGWNHSFHDSVDGVRDMPAVDLRGKMSLVRNSDRYFVGLQFLFDAHLYHSKFHNFINSQEDIAISTGIRF